MPEIQTADAGKQQTRAERTDPHVTPQPAARAIVGALPVSGLLTNGVPLRRLATADDPLGGQAAPQGVLDVLRRSAGRGTPLPNAVQSDLGRRLGADLSAIRIHHDEEAHGVAQAVQSVAFTHGRDIYFSRGRFDPASAAGQHLLAHELAHATSVERSSGSVTTIGRADDPAERAADATADAVTGSLRRKSFDGPVDVTPVPAEIRRQRDPEMIRRAFGKVKKFAKSLFGKADPVPDVTTGTAYMDNKTHDERMDHQRRSRGSGPGENPDYSNPALFGAAPDEWDVTLAVAQEDPAWMRNIKDLKKTALAELPRSPRQLLGDLDAAQQRLVERTLLRRGDLDNKTQTETQALVEKFSDGLHDVGHTWIRLTTYTGGKLKEIYSYGMWPQKLYAPGENGRTHGGYAGPVSIGPGEVKHPDTAHEDDETKAYKRFPVKKAEFGKALDLAVKRYNNPPPYVLTGYNCTAFAREVLMAAGKTYPGKGLLPGFAYTPGDLYWAIMKEWAKGKKGVTTDDTAEESAGMKKLKDRADVFAEAGEANVEGEYKTATFQLPPPGQQRRIVKLHAGARIDWGMYPGNLSETLTIDEDTEYTVIVDPQFAGRHGCIPVEIGAQIAFVDQDDFYRAAAPPREPTQREAFLARGLSYWGTLRPPADGREPTGVWSEQEVARQPLLEFKDENATDQWMAVSARGEIYWVRRDHLAIFRNPGSARFDDEGDTATDSSSGNGDAGTAGDDARIAAQKAAVASMVARFEGVDASTLAHILSTGTNTTRNGIVVTLDLVSELIRNEPEYAETIAKLIGCSVGDINENFT